MLRDARKDSDRYQLIRRKVTYQELKQIRKFPIFNMGKYKGGLIVMQQNKRILPFRSLAARTIGYKNENAKNDGKRLLLVWKALMPTILTAKTANA